jgi:uncharacterized C2H2 Zn-finger protein
MKRFELIRALSFSRRKYRDCKIGLFKRCRTIDDKVKIRCPNCTRIFRERASRLRDGYQLNCPNCNRLLTINTDTEDPYLRRALKTAREVRAILEAEALRARRETARR